MFSDAIGVMLLTHDHYRQFTQRPIGDARRESQTMIALTADSRDAVNATLEKAVAAGGRADPDPPRDLGFMFNRHVEDPDGYVWDHVHGRRRARPGVQTGVIGAIRRAAPGSLLALACCNWLPVPSRRTADTKGSAL